MRTRTSTSAARAAADKTAIATSARQPIRQAVKRPGRKRPGRMCGRPCPDMYVVRSGGQRRHSLSPAGRCRSAVDCAGIIGTKPTSALQRNRRQWRYRQISQRSSASGGSSASCPLCAASSNRSSSAAQQLHRLAAARRNLVRFPAIVGLGEQLAPRRTSACDSRRNQAGVRIARCCGPIEQAIRGWRASHRAIPPTVHCAMRQSPLPAATLGDRREQLVRLHDPLRPSESVLLARETERTAARAAARHTAPRRTARRGDARPADSRAAT